MIKKESGQSVYDIAIKVAGEMNDIVLKDNIQQLRDHHLVQVKRANVVLHKLTSGLPDQSQKGNGVDPINSIADEINLVIRENLDADSIYEFLSICGVRLADLRSSYRGHKNAEILHSQPGGSREKRAQIIAAWRSGKYASRDICAEQECAGLNMSFSVARKALINIPKST